jgi:hydrogenase expression/formation protein HypC
MCLAIPAQITSADGFKAQVEIGGVGRTISLMLTPEAKVGDYVLVHTGYSISVVDAAEALESLRLFQELAETYSPEELFLSTGDASPHSSERLDPLSP